MESRSIVSEISHASTSVSSLTSSFSENISLHTITSSNNSQKSLTTRNNQFEPKKDNSVYFAVYFNLLPEGFIENLLENVQESEQQYWNGFKSIIQFFVDLVGYQHFNIANYNTDDIVNKLQDEKMNSELSDVFDYILNLHSKKPKILAIQNQIFEFISELIENLYSTECYQFLNDLQDFVCQMVKAKCYPIIHTGVIIAMKIITASAKIIVELEEQLKTLNQNMKLVRSGHVCRKSAVDDVKNSENKMRICSTNITRLYTNGFETMCHYEDKLNKLNSMREQCAEEICIWIKILPKFFISRFIKVHLSLFAYIETDMATKVGAAAMRTCLKLFQCQNFKEMVSKSVITDFVRVIAPFCQCITLEIAIAAIEIITIVVTEALVEIPPQLTYSKFNGTDAKEMKFAQACGELITAQIRQQAKEDEFKFIRKYVKIVGNFQNPHKMHCMIEATYDDIPELKNWDLTFKLLLRRKTENKLSDAEYNILFYIIFELAKQTVTGRNSIRSFEAARNPNQNDVIDFNQSFIPLCKRLITTYSDEKEKEIILFKSIKLIDTTFILDDSFKEYLKQLKDLTFKRVTEETDEKYLTIYVECLNHLGQNMGPFADVITQELNQFASQEIIPDLRTNIENNETIKEELLAQLVVIYEYMSMNSNFGWNEIFLDWRREAFLNKCSSKSFANLLRLCSHWLRWESFNFEIKNGQNLSATAFISFTNKCRDYIGICLGIISWKNGKDSQIRYVAFVELCRICIAHECVFQNLLQKKLESESEEECSPWTDKCIIQISNYECLVEYMKEVAFVNFELTEYEQRIKIIMSLINLIEDHFLPPSTYKHIFVYYNTHKSVYCNLYERLFEELRKMDPRCVPFLIIESMTELLHQIPFNADRTNLDELKNVQHLAHCFADKINTQLELMDIFKIGADVIVNGDYRLCRILKYFVRKLTGANRAAMFKHVHEKKNTMSEEQFKPFTKLLELLKH